MDTRFSKHIENTENSIKTLIWKVWIGWFTLHNCITMHSTKNTKFFLMFSQALIISLLSFKFSRASDLFVMSIWYCFLTSRSLYYPRLNLSPSNFCASCLLTVNSSPTFPPQLLQPLDSDKYHSRCPWKIVRRVYSNSISCLSICDQSCCESSHQERSSCTYDVLVWEHCALNTLVFWCAKVYYSNIIFITVLM
jgi:hypothetical protein